MKGRCELDFDTTICSISVVQWQERLSGYLNLLYELLFVQQNNLDMKGLYGGPAAHLETFHHL